MQNYNAQEKNAMRQYFCIANLNNAVYVCVLSACELFCGPQSIMSAKKKNERPGMTSFEATDDVMQLLEIVNRIGGRGERSRIINDMLRKGLPLEIDRLMNDQQKVLDEIRSKKKRDASRAPDQHRN